MHTHSIRCTLSYPKLNLYVNKTPSWLLTVAKPSVPRNNANTECDDTEPNNNSRSRGAMCPDNSCGCNPTSGYFWGRTLLRSCHCWCWWTTPPNSSPHPQRNGLQYCLQFYWHLEHHCCPGSLCWTWTLDHRGKCHKWCCCCGRLVCPPQWPPCPAGWDQPSTLYLEFRSRYYLDIVAWPGPGTGWWQLPRQCGGECGPGKVMAIVCLGWPLQHTTTATTTTRGLQSAENVKYPLQWAIFTFVCMDLQWHW